MKTGVSVKKSLIAVSIGLVLGASPIVHAQPFSPSIGNGGGSIDQQVIGDTNASADHTQSQANQLGNAANANGATITTGVDTRDQNTNNVNPTATGGAAIGNQSDNKSNASNGNQSLDGRSQVGNVGSTSGGNITGGNTMTGGANTAAGGAGGAGGQGGAGGLAAQGQQQANTGTNAQGQTSANRNTQGQTNAQGQVNGQTTTAGNGAGASAGAGAGASAGAGAGSGNRTANTTRVDASDRSSTTNSYVSKAIVLPPIVHAQAAPPLASAAMTVIPGVCGPRHYTETKPVVGTHHGIIWDSGVPQGDDYTAVAAATPFIEKDGYVIGHVLNEYVAVVGTSSSKSISAYGVGSQQNGGGAGAANSGSHQQMVVRITVKDCLMPVKPVKEEPKIVFESAMPQRAARPDRN